MALRMTSTNSISDHHTPSEEPLDNNDRSTNPMSNHQLTGERVLGARREPYFDAATQTGSSQHHEPLSRSYTRQLEIYFSRQTNFLQRVFRPWLPSPTQLHPGHPLSFDPGFQELVPKGFVAQAIQDEAELCYINEALAKKTKECDKLRARLRTSDEELAELRGIKEALNEKIQDCEQIKENWQAAVGELTDLKSSKSRFMVDDAEMTAKWKKLQFAIKNLARSYLGHAIPPEQLTNKQKKLLESFTPFYQVLLSADGQVHLLFQTMVWMQVATRVLGKPTMIWGQTVSNATDEVFKYGPDSLEDYHAWRAETGELIQNKKGISKTQETYLKTEMHSMVVAFIPGATLGNERDAAIIRRAVDAIIDKAIELAVVFNQSRCVYCIEHVIHRRTFESAMMEFYDEECDALNVDFMISPALVKYGNSLGKDYHERLVLAKSLVYSFDRGMQQDGGDREALIEL
ncbi:hypothetical protein F5Y09DRAFT_355700 [Xylaria sp. FL1042]|nr:hypothetical protein F5Y09DRAFT_355700 [Xylaria sp. FL1042]